VKRGGEPPAILVSYHYAKASTDRWDAFFVEAKRAGWHVLLDSGAFSAWCSGKVIRLDEYVRYLDMRRDLFSAGYIQLDVVSDNDSTLRNLEAMVRARLSPIPVLTQDMPIARAADMVALAGNDTLCVAGGVTWPDREMAARYTLVNRAVPKVKLHGLGFTRNSLAWRVPLFSSDSSSWQVGGRYGQATVFNRREGCAHVQLPKLFKKGWAALPRRLQRVMDESCIGPRNWSDKLVHRTHASWINVMGTVAWLQYGDHMRSTGRRFYFALVGPDKLTQLAAAQMHRTASGGCKYPDCVVTYLRLRELCRTDRTAFWRFVFREVDWRTTCNDASL